MEYLKVKNLEKFQHYKNRQPPWIKLHRSIFEDYEFSRLQDASKLHLILIWVLASQCENKIPNDPAWIKEKLQLKKPINLNPLIESGFLIRYQDASKMLAGVKKYADSETETETYKQETETYKQETDSILEISEKNFEKIWAEYPSKDGRKAALRHFLASVKTEKDLSDIWVALCNYSQSVELRAKRNGGERFWKNGSTWFNNWRDWIDWKEPEKSETTESKIQRQIREEQEKNGSKTE